MRFFRITGSRLPFWVEWGSLVVAVPLAVLVVSGSQKHPPAALGAQVREDNQVSLENARTRLEQYFEEAHLKLRVIRLQHKVVATGQDARGFVRLPVTTDDRPRHFADIRIIPRQPDRESPQGREGTRQVKHLHVPALKDDAHPTHLQHLERFAEDPALEVLLSGPVSSRAVDPQLVLSVPIRADGELVGIVAGAVPLESLLQTLQQDWGAGQVVLASTRGGMFSQAYLPCEMDVFSVQGVTRFFETRADQFNAGKMPAVWCRPDIPGDLNWYLAVMHRSVGEAKTGLPSRGTAGFPG